MRRWLVALVIAGVGLSGSPVRADDASAAGRGTGPEVDAYRTGYAQAVIDQGFALEHARVVVRGSVATVTLKQSAKRDAYRLEQTLLNLPGVERVELVIQAPASTTESNDQAAETSAATAPEDGRSKVASQAGSSDASTQAQSAAPWLNFARAVQLQQYPQGLPPGHLFDVLLADPRWPSLYASYQGYINQDLEHVGGVGFGAAVPLVRDEFALGGLWEFGIHAGVHAIFDLASDSFDLQNADYYVAGALGYRYGDFSALLRVYHESSHLGDEFILGNPTVQRIDLSYEMAHLLASYDLTAWLRVYGGAGYLINRYPDSFDRVQIQYGAEARSPVTLFDGVLRPIAAVDVQHWQEFDFAPDVSVRAGVELFDEAVLPHRLQLLLEYYVGRSPHGQFYPDAIQSLGVALRFHY